MGRQRHSLELGLNRRDNFWMANPHVVDAKSPEAVDELAAHDVLDDRPLACPFDGGKVLSFRDGFAVVEKTAIKVVVEILQRVGNDAILVFGIESFPAAEIGRA